MDFKNASLEELKQFVKEHKIKGVSALSLIHISEPTRPY